ncbi:MAG: C39 family peptidase [Micropruina sp.]|uniref:C39 family peptidase n=1 Tax=Micropruina sp. TaxID=2737536 RepID=UPI0039E583FF
MAEKILPYDRSVVPQETGYWCGPASTQVVLNSRGIRVAESDLAREIGTTVNGTDYIGLIEKVLDRRVPAAQYTSVYMPNDPPTSAQKTRLWADLRRSIDAGWGVVANIVAPPSNYPRGVKGSQSPAYGGGTVFHYIPLMGYDDTARAVWVADSGFRPFGYWVSFDQLATLIPPKGYCYANVNAPAAPSPAPTAPSLMQDVRAQLCGSSVDYRGWPQLGGRTLTDAIAAVLDKLGAR